ncbi:MAG TPA: hypothetical protein VN711_01520 [Candidatus Saccharimonadales bacterium]|nr:hypothetical protein [Candidatus Saccharimonadales bacterium]
MERVLFLSTKRRFASWGQENHQEPKLPVASGAAWLAEMDKLARLKNGKEQREAGDRDSVILMAS